MRFITCKYITNVQNHVNLNIIAEMPYLGVSKVYGPLCGKLIMHVIFIWIYLFEASNFRQMKNIYLQILNDKQGISELVLATVTGTSGSTPQKPGSSALFSKSGLEYGTVGGGILEGKVEQFAIEALLSKKPVHKLFSLDKSTSDGEDALCGGRITILIDPLLERHSSLFGIIRESSLLQIPGVLITGMNVLSGGEADIKRYWVTRKSIPDISSGFSAAIIEMAGEILSSSDPYDCREMRLPSEKEGAAEIYFLEPVLPHSRLIIAGAGHIGKALAKLGQMLDFDVTVIDDRPEYANSGNIPDADHILTGEIESMISNLNIDKDTFIVIVTRGHRDDAGALRSCISSDAAYIGMIGSKNKNALMHRNFLENGWATEELWRRIYAPVGLDIGSKSVEEIAVSIAAQLIKIRNARK